MLNIEDKQQKPALADLLDHSSCPLLREMCREMEELYQPVLSIEYSGDKVLLGWNIKFKKAGRTLCTVYPREGHFFLLLVIGQREKERAEAMLPALSGEFQRVYRATREGMGQRWLLFDFAEPTAAFDDVRSMIRLRRESGKKQ